MRPLLIPAHRTAQTDARLGQIENGYLVDEDLIPADDWSEEANCRRPQTPRPGLGWGSHPAPFQLLAIDPRSTSPPASDDILPEIHFAPDISSITLMLSNNKTAAH
jgi:hypothetical protein